jgi:hypothetical protein
MIIGFFRTLIIITIIYFALRFIFRIVIPIILGNYLNRKVSQAQNHYHQNEYSRREGEVTINNSSKHDKKYKNNEGEYVDFEEIKE